MLTRLPPTASANSSMRKPNGPQTKNKLGNQVKPLSFLQVASHKASSLIQLWARFKIRYGMVCQSEGMELLVFNVCICSIPARS